MTLIAEGVHVSYVGDEVDDLAVGDTGRVLSAAGTGSHVKWTTGKCAGTLSLIRNSDLVVTKHSFSYDDLDAGTLVTIAVRPVYDNYGSTGLLNALNDEGHLATFAPIAEEAILHVASRIREDPSIKEVLSSLDPDEGAEFVSLAASILLRDAFGAEGDS